MSTYPQVLITDRGYGQLNRGSLWVFANEFQTKVKNLQPGGWVEFHAPKRGFVGFGYVNPQSLITGRILSRTPVTDRKSLLKSLLEKAVASRHEYKDVGSYRAVFSESDDLPGLIVDVYGAGGEAVVVAQLTTAGMDNAKDDLKEVLKDVFKPKALIFRCDSSIRHLEGVKQYNELVFGDEASLKKAVVKEYDTLFSADFLDGQKTGFFLDQRENRKYLGEHCKGKRVLDLCCYSGGWGLTALTHGAAHVTFVDQSKEALELVKEGMALNKIDMSKAEFKVDDVFEYLQKEPQAFDIVICDPPAFVKSKKNLPQAIQAYKKLNLAALKRLKMGGNLYSCSCSFHLGEGELKEILTESLQKTGLLGRVIHRGGQAGDHPWVLNRPESHYLKCLVVEVKV